MIILVVYVLLLATSAYFELGESMTSIRRYLVRVVLLAPIVELVVLIFRVVFIRKVPRD